MMSYTILDFSQQQQGKVYNNLEQRLWRRQDSVMKLSSVACEILPLLLNTHSQCSKQQQSTKASLYRVFIVIHGKNKARL